MQIFALLENYIFYLLHIPSTGIHVLRILKYDRQSLGLRRLQSENVDADPIVWTNQRFIRWARSIDLGEYAENLKGEQIAF
jgi:SAM domain (Sterile alpha motif)